MITDTYHVYVDSHNRSSGSHNDFTIGILMPPGKSYDRVVVLNAIIPKSFYLINSSNNTFILTENSTSVTITVPNGDYLLGTFQTVIQGLLNTNSPHSWTYVVTYPTITSQPNTGKYTFTVSGNSGFQPAFTFTNNLNRCMGFDPNTTNTFSANSLTSPNVIKLQVADRLFINSNIVAGEQGEDACVLQEINCSPSPDFSSVVYQCTAPENYSKPFNSGANSYKFSLTDEDFNILPLNGQPIQFTLQFYRRDDVYDKVKSFMRMIALEK